MHDNYAICTFVWHPKPSARIRKHIAVVFIAEHYRDMLALTGMRVTKQAKSSYSMNPETSAWLMLIGSFLLFCLLVAFGSYSIWKFYNTATVPIEQLPQPGVVRVHANAGVVYQQRGRTELITPRELCADSIGPVTDVCFGIEEGYRVRTVPEAGYGPVASIVLPDHTQIDLQAYPIGTDITLQRYQVSRWNNSLQEVVFQQHAGYARYDIRENQDYENVIYRVRINEMISIKLAPGGSYSINVPNIEGKSQWFTVDGKPLQAEVAVRNGLAEIDGPSQDTTIGAGQLVQITNESVLSVPMLAQWELLKDGQFSQQTTEEYNAGSETWFVVSDMQPPVGEPRGVFTIINGCHPIYPDLCPLPAERTTIGQFWREGNTQGQYITGIAQLLDIDVSEYRQLNFSAWTRVLSQSVEGAGVDGTECPMLITVEYRNTGIADELQRSRICVYTGEEAPVKQNYIHYVNIERFAWEHLQIDLRSIPELRTARYLRQIIIEARGHDYLTQITDVSLIGAE
jgi:hypothetical protein